MRRFAAIFASLVLFVSLTASVSAGPVDQEGVRILLSAGDARAAGLNVRHGFGAKVSAQVPPARLQVLKQRGITFELIPVLELAPEPGEPAYDVAIQQKAEGRSVPLTQIPWGVKAVYGNPDLTPAGIGNGGAGIAVAVLDTGSTNHPDFYRADGSPVITQCVDFSDKKVSVVEGSCQDGHGHGTHVTGTLAAAGGRDGRGIFGVAPGVSVYSYKVLTDKGGGYADDVAMGIRTAADRGAKIISMSFGRSSIVPLIQEAIQYASSKGVLLVAAAGNAGPTANTISYSAAYSQVVGVASLNQDESVSWFSSRGISDGDDRTITEREIEVAAPGQNVISTAADGSYSLMNGTSMATPHISGLAARNWQGSAARTRSWLVSQAKRHDITAAEQASDAGIGYDTASGYGMPQVNPLFQPLWND